MEQIRYILSKRVDPYWNLALEELVFNELDRNYTYFMLWQNDNTIVIGKNQNTVEQINGAFVEEAGVKVARRCSGGGAVYHDMGNLNFTFITDAPKMEELNFRLFCQPVIEALSRCGVDAALTGRNDMTIEGKKFSGNSQYIREKRVMHHGTIMFHSDLSVLERALQVSEDKIKSKGVASIRSRVTNVVDHLTQEVTLDQFRDILVACVGENCQLEPFAITPEMEARVATLAHDKYETWEWNYGHSPQYKSTKKRRIDQCGLVEVSLEVEGGYIKNIAFFGDFFGSGDLNELSALLKGCPCHKEGILERLAQVDLTWYVHQLSKEQLADLIVL